jgi:hypothetical protein
LATGDMAGPVLFTAGYVGHDVVSFLSLLVRHGAEVCVAIP